MNCKALIRYIQGHLWVFKGVAALGLCLSRGHITSADLNTMTDLILLENAAHTFALPSPTKFAESGRITKENVHMLTTLLKPMQMGLTG